MGKMKRLGKIRNVLFTLGIGLAVISMLVMDYLELFGLLSALLAMVSLVSGLVLMIVILIQNKNERRNT